MTKKLFIKIAPLIITLALVLLVERYSDVLFFGEPLSSVTSDDLLQQAFENQTSDIQVQGQGKVIKNLPDDNDGSRHQRFILRVSTGQTVLVAHNIDLAPRIRSLQEGDAVEFFGEYEWNSQGGVIHWTHRDPSGNHVHGWLKHQDEIYE